MGITGNPRRRFQKWAFDVEIEGVRYAGFQKCGELSAETATVQIYEGGKTIPHKSLGRQTFSKVTLERGASLDMDLYDWYVQANDAATGGGAVDDAYKRDVDIVQRDRDGTELVRWTLIRAMPTKYSAGDRDNEADEFVIESIELDFDRFELRVP